MTINPDRLSPSSRKLLDNLGPDSPGITPIVDNIARHLALGMTADEVRAEWISHCNLAAAATRVPRDCPSRAKLQALVSELVAQVAEQVKPVPRLSAQWEPLPVA
jgi:hypothetical protein